MRTTLYAKPMPTICYAHRRFRFAENKSNCNSTNGDAETIKRKESVTDLHTKRINEKKINKIGFGILMTADRWWPMNYIHIQHCSLYGFVVFGVGAATIAQHYLCIQCVSMCWQNKAYIVQYIPSKSRFSIRQIAFNVQFYQFSTNSFFESDTVMREHKVPTFGAIALNG